MLDGDLREPLDWRELAADRRGGGQMRGDRLESVARLDEPEDLVRGAEKLEVAAFQQQVDVAVGDLGELRRELRVGLREL